MPLKPELPPPPLGPPRPPGPPRLSCPPPPLPPPPGAPPPPAGEGGDDHGLMATIEELRVGCLELRVWLRTAQDHGGVAVKKLGDATAQLDALKAMEQQLADEGSASAPAPRASSSQEGTDSEQASELRQRAEDAELALVRAEAEIARLTRVSRHLSTGGASTESDTEGGEEEDSGQPSTPGGTPIERRMRAASLHTIVTVEALEAEGKQIGRAHV